MGAIARTLDQGDTMDRETDITALSAAAASGDPRAQLQLGQQAERAGRSADARSWYARAAQAGLAEAQYALGRLLEASGEAEAAEAARWHMAAAEQGHEDAQLALARLYRFGRGVARDAEAAAAWSRRALSTGLEALYRRAEQLDRDRARR